MSFLIFIRNNFYGPDTKAYVIAMTSHDKLCTIQSTDGRQLNL